LEDIKNECGMMFTNFRMKNLLLSIQKIVPAAKACLRVANMRQLPLQKYKKKNSQNFIILPSIYHDLEREHASVEHT
jgi:hypothetical protein